jgi:hypothetical protein
MHLPIEKIDLYFYVEVEFDWVKLFKNTHHYFSAESKAANILLDLNLSKIDFGASANWRALLR